MQQCLNVKCLHHKNKGYRLQIFILHEMHNSLSKCFTQNQNKKKYIFESTLIFHRNLSVDENSHAVHDIYNVMPKNSLVVNRKQDALKTFNHQAQNEMAISLSMINFHSMNPSFSVIKPKYYLLAEHMKHSFESFVLL